MGGERPPHEQGAGVLCFRSVWGRGRKQTAAGTRAGACRLRAGSAGGRSCRGWVANVRPTSRGRAFCVFVPFGAREGTDGGRLTGRSLPPSSRQCRRPELPRMGGERPPHEQGAGVLCFRSVWGEGGNRRRQAHGQEPAACDIFGVRMGFSRDESLERVRAEPAVPPPPRDGRGGNGGCGRGWGFAPGAPAAKRRKEGRNGRRSRKTRAMGWTPRPKRRISVLRRARRPFFKGRPPRK